MPLRLLASDYRLDIDAAHGGAITRFTWRGTPLFRASCGPSMLDAACFPLVPFSNRIANGRFALGGRDVTIAPNFPDSDHPHPLHGFGWLTRWTVAEQKPHCAVLRHEYPGGEWPWPYAAEQIIALSGDGLVHRLSVQNLGDSPMPAGLGLHPYFPRGERTRLVAFHRGEWTTGADGLPIRLDEREDVRDWWAGAPIGSRDVDTVYTGRSGPMTLLWPETGTALDIRPSDNLPFTAIYTPAGQDFFCAEPVSHATDAIHRPDGPGAMALLAPGETMRVQVAYSAHWI